MPGMLGLKVDEERPWTAVDSQVQCDFQGLLYNSAAQQRYYIGDPGDFADIYSLSYSFHIRFGFFRFSFQSFSIFSF